MAAPQEIATVEAGAAERRAHVRWRTPEVNARVHLDGRSEPCRLKDISAGGAGLYADFAATVGQHAVLELSPRCSLPGRVVRVARDAIGIRFAIEPALMARIEELIGLGLGPSDW
jgi:hypothetical protein